MSLGTIEHIRDIIEDKILDKTYKVPWLTIDSKTCKIIDEEGCKKCPFYFNCWIDDLCYFLE